MMNVLGDPLIVALLIIAVGIVRVKLTESDRHIRLKDQALGRRRVVEVSAAGNHRFGMRLADFLGDAIGESPQIMTCIALGADIVAILGAALRTTAHVRVVVEHHREIIPHRRTIKPRVGVRLAVKIVVGDLNHLLKKPRCSQARLDSHLIVHLLHLFVALAAEPLRMRLAISGVVTNEGVVRVILHVSPGSVPHPIEQADPRINHG